MGELERAQTILEAAVAFARRQRVPPEQAAFILDELGEVAFALGQPSQARAWLDDSLELRYETGERFGIAQTLDRLAALAAMSQQPQRALQLAGTADALYDVIGARRTPAELFKREQWLPPLREAVGREAADEAWAAGRALKLEDIVALALSGPQTDPPQPAATPPKLAVSILSAREQEVAVLLAQGLSNRQIAAELVISTHTTQRHVENILDKLGFSSRTQVAAWAVGRGMLAAPSAEAPI
jgi:DNA-binding CsgD family transcriptional regulator